MSYEIITENVPDFTKRLGDRVIEGSNNSIMIFGTDRSAPGEATINDGFGHTNAKDGGRNSPAWHVIVGRKGENPNFNSDKAYIYMSAKTNPDDVMSLSGVEKTSLESSSILMKADDIRVVARNSLKISVGKCYIYINSDGSVVLDGNSIKIGKNALQKIIRGSEFMKLFNGHTHPTAVGPSGTPLLQMIESIHLSGVGFIE